MSIARTDYCGYSGLPVQSFNILGEPPYAVEVPKLDEQAMIDLAMEAKLSRASVGPLVGADGCFAWFECVGMREPRWLGVTREPVVAEWMPQVLTAVALARRQSDLTGLRAGTIVRGHLIVRLDYAPPMQPYNVVGRPEVARRAFKQLSLAHQANVLHGGINERWISTTPGAERLVLGFGLATAYAAWRNANGVPVGWMVADPRFASADELISGEASAASDRAALGRVLRLGGRSPKTVRTGLDALIERQVSDLPRPQLEFDTLVEELVKGPDVSRSSDTERSEGAAGPLDAGTLGDALATASALVSRLDVVVRKAEIAGPPVVHSFTSQAGSLTPQDRRLIEELRDALTQVKVETVPPRVSSPVVGDRPEPKPLPAVQRTLWVALAAVALLQIATLGILAIGANSGRGSDLDPVAPSEGSPEASAVKQAGQSGISTGRSTGVSDSLDPSTGMGAVPPTAPVAALPVAPDASVVPADGVVTGAGAGKDAPVAEVITPPFSGKYEKQFKNGPPYAMGTSDIDEVIAWKAECKAVSGNPSGTLIGKSVDPGPQAAFSPDTTVALGINVTFKKGAKEKALLTLTCRR